MVGVEKAKIGIRYAAKSLDGLVLCKPIPKHVELEMRLVALVE